MTPVTATESTHQAQGGVCSLSPLDLVLKAYDVALEGCHEHDADKVGKAVVELIASLNFEYRDVAMGLFRLYDYCLRRARAGDFQAVATILAELRETWAQVERQQAREAV